MSLDLYTNKWLFYPYLKNNDLNYLIHPNDLKKFDNLGVVRGIEIDGDYLKVESKGKLVVRVKTEGINRTLPSPDFIWNDNVCIISKPNSKATIEDFFWHHNREEFLYYLKVDGKKKNKHYRKDELKECPTTLTL